jgi:hypothetical protein
MPRDGVPARPIYVAAQRQMPGEDSRHGGDVHEARIVLASCVAVGIGSTLVMPVVQVHSADKEQRFPLLQLEQLNDQQRPLADEILKVASIGIGSLQFDVAQPRHGPAHVNHLGARRSNRGRCPHVCFRPGDHPVGESGDVPALC